MLLKRFAVGFALISTAALFALAGSGCERGGQYFAAPKASTYTGYWQPLDGAPAEQNRPASSTARNSMYYLAFNSRGEAYRITAADATVPDAETSADGVMRTKLDVKQMSIKRLTNTLISVRETPSSPEIHFGRVAKSQRIALFRGVASLIRERTAARKQFERQKGNRLWILDSKIETVTGADRSVKTTETPASALPDTVTVHDSHGSVVSIPVPKTLRFVNSTKKAIEVEVNSQMIMKFVPVLDEAKRFGFVIYALDGETPVTEGFVRDTADGFELQGVPHTTDAGVTTVADYKFKPAP